MSLPLLSRIQATKAFAPRSFPTGISTTAGAWSDARFTYNLKPKHLKTLRAAAAKATAGVVGDYDVNFIGDSITRGQGVSSPANYGDRSWPAQVRKLFVARGITAAGDSSGYVPAMSGGGIADPRHTLAGTWTAVSGINTVLQQTNSGVGASWTFTSTNAGTIVEFLYADTTSPISFTIDGGAATTITGTGTNTMKRYQVTGLPNTTHTVVASATNTSGMYVGAFRVRSTSALNFNNWGHYGAKASTFGNPTSGQLFGTLAAVNQCTTPVATFISLMTNEIAGGSPESAATYKTNLNNLISYLTNPADIILCAAIPSTFAQDYSAHRQALYEIADARDLPVIDFYPRYIDGTTMNANGLLSDSAHPNASGYFDMAQLVNEALR